MRFFRGCFITADVNFVTADVNFVTADVSFRTRRPKSQPPDDERGEASGVSKVFLRIARKSIFFEQKT